MLFRFVMLRVFYVWFVVNVVFWMMFIEMVFCMCVCCFFMIVLIFVFSVVLCVVCV